MKKIQKDELFENVKQFLSIKGIQLTEGPYSQTVHRSCRILADVINLGQQGIERAKTGIDQKLDQVRDVIHQKTAPRSSAGANAEGEAGAHPTGAGQAKADSPSPTNGNRAASASADSGSSNAVKKPGKIRPKQTAARAKAKAPKKPKPPVT